MRIQSKHAFIAAVVGIGLLGGSLGFADHHEEERVMEEEQVREEEQASHASSLQLLNFRVNPILAFNDVGYSFSGQIYWSPRFHLNGTSFEFRGILGATALNTAEGNVFLAPEFQAMAGYIVTGRALDAENQPWVYWVDGEINLVPLDSESSLHSVVGFGYRAE
jgi:hypothetical protein